MDSYPYQRNQIPYVPYRYYYHPNAQISRPPPNLDPGKPYESCPFYAYPQPHGCCGHSYQPPSHCAFGPTYAPHTAPPPFHYAPPGSHPFCYLPQPYVSMDRPCYDFRKNFPAEYHCCGCPNHHCKPNETNAVKIEEHDEGLDKKNAEAMVPFNAKSEPYPVGWFPCGDGCREKTKECGDAYNGWLPLNFFKRSADGLEKGEDLLKTQHKPDANSMRFPFPIIWMPDQPEDSQKMERQGTDLCQKSDIESAPHMESKQSRSSKVEDNALDSMKNKGVPGNGEKMVHKGVSFPKVIPVKQLEDNDVKCIPNKIEGESTIDPTKHDTNNKSTNASTKPNTNNRDGKLDGDGPKKASTSKKTSKLPPVCLRVDPFPRKKVCNGSSRSLTHSGAEGKQNVVPKDKCPVSLNGAETCKNKGWDGTSGVAVEETAQGNTHRNVNVECRDGASGVAVEGTSEGKARKDVNVGCAVSSASENCTENDSFGVEGAPSWIEMTTGSDDNSECDNPNGQMRTQIKSLPSEDEAATKIQSAYRAFEVRKWEPLKKLKQIVSIREKVAEIRSDIQALYDSSNKPVDDKQKNVITEKIMGLLLKLDMIQGLHPIVKDVRKSVARELVSLQEKLDNGSLQVEAVPEPEQPIAADDTMKEDGNAMDVQGPTNTMDRCEDLPHPTECLQENDGQGIDDQVDDAFAGTQPPCSKELLEAKDILEPTNWDAESTDISNGLPEPLQVSTLLKEIEEIPAQDKILNSVEQVAAQTQPCEVLDNEESRICREATTTVDDVGGLPQDLSEDKQVAVESSRENHVEENKVILDTTSEYAVEDASVPKLPREEEPEDDEKRVCDENVIEVEGCGDSDATDGGDGKVVVMEEEELRKVMEGLIEAGKEQLAAINALSVRVTQLEKRLLSRRKKKAKVRKPKMETKISEALSI
ncbi:hypothetical protein DM860_016712 [Cuscuta australis]|uniref:BAG domain-containing protein n=1 Tax=Cuscuta australis TaxID=267555 RepID=A0A328DPL2_9ASTE|nr:hypothetical protein DM860_016712 [Cuscuta australis]